MSTQLDTHEQLPSHRKALAIAVSAAIAGTGTNTAQADGLEEIVVTATKREQSLQDIPMSVTAFTDAEIVKQGFKALDDYAKEIPGLAFTRREPGGTTLVMRGCATSGVAFVDNPTTSIYLDEQPISAAGVNPDPRLIDISRVEALSGPQGSLFGAASQCGTLRIITNKPNIDEFDSWVDVSPISAVEHGDLGYEASGMVNIPLVDDKLALRLVGFYSEEAGYIDNVLRPSPGYNLSSPIKDGGTYQGGAFNNAAFAEDDINSTTNRGARAALRWTPTEKYTIDAMATWQSTKSDGFGDTDLNEGVFAGYGLGELDQVRFSNDFWDDEWYQVSLTGEANLKYADVTLTGSYLNRQTRYDADSTSYIATWSETFHGGAYNFYFARYDWGNYLAGAGRTAGDLRASSWDDGETERWSFEARAATPDDLDSRWGGIVGLFWDKNTDDTVFKANVNGQSTDCTDGGGFYSDFGTRCTYAHMYLSFLHYFYFGVYQPKASDNWWTGVYHTETKEKAVFGEISFDFTDKFTLTAGGRWFEIEQDRTLKNGNSSTGDTRDTTVFNCATDQDKANWQVTAITGTLVNTAGTSTVTGTTVGWTGGTSTSGSKNTCYNDTATSSTESDWVPKVNVTYRFDDDKMVYATYSEGFRRGGINNAKTGVFATGGEFHDYQSDTLINYEAGFKTSWLDDRLRFNLTGYHMVWEDILIQVQDPTEASFTLGLINLTEATINGFEISAAALPAEGWDIRGTVGLNRARLSEDTDVLGSILASGTRLPLSPELKSSVNVTYTFPQRILQAEPYISGSWAYQGDSFNSLAGLGGTAFLSPVRKHGDYHLLNLRAGMESDDWTAAVFINNVTDEVGEMFFNDRWAQTRLSVTQPRTFGLVFRKYFGK